MTGARTDMYNGRMADRLEQPGTALIDPVITTRQAACHACEQCAALADSTVDCRLSRDWTLSLQFGRCPLRKWSDGSRMAAPPTRSTVSTSARPTDASVNRAVCRLAMYPPEQRALIDARRAVCAACESGRNVTDLTVHCRACDCKGLSLLLGRCKLRKWPDTAPAVPGSPGRVVQAEAALDQFQHATVTRASRHENNDDARHPPPVASAAPRDAPSAARSPITTADSMPVPLADFYRGRGAFLIGGGPSFATVDHALLRQPGVLTMAVNNAARTFRPNLWVCVDDPANFIRSVWLDPTILKFAPIGNADKRIFNSDAWSFTPTRVRDCPATFFYRRNERFAPDQWLVEDSFNWGNAARFGGGRSVMLVALKLLYYLGVRTVYLLGVDFRMTDQYTYHFKQKRKPGSIRGNNATYQKLQEWFGELAPRFARAGFRVYNCNPDSGLTAFEHVPIDHALQSLLAEWGHLDVHAERTEDLYDELKRR